MIKFYHETLFNNHKEIPSYQTTKIYNPASKTECVGEISLGTIEHVHQAVEAADEAWKGWAKTTPYERGEIVGKLADFMVSHFDSFAELLVRENGRISAEIKGDILGGSNVLRYYSSLAEEVAKEEIIENHQGKMVLTRQSMGVTSIIVP
jgi:aldehyde dehydrogenase